MPDIRNVYIFSHFTGEEFYNRTPQDKALVVVEYDDCFLIHRKRSLDDDPLTVNIERDATREQRLHAVHAFVEIYTTQIDKP
jgi:hypothetical protein